MSGPFTKKKKQETKQHYAEILSLMLLANPE